MAHTKRPVKSNAVVAALSAATNHIKASDPSALSQAWGPLLKSAAAPVEPASPGVESKRVDDFANMSDEELEAYVNGDRGLEH